MLRVVFCVFWLMLTWSQSACDECSKECERACAQKGAGWYCVGETETQCKCRRDGADDSEAQFCGDDNAPAHARGPEIVPTTMSAPTEQTVAATKVAR